MKRVVALIMLTLVCASAMAATYKRDTAALRRYALSSMVERRTLVVVGTVEHMDYVYREDVLPGGKDSATTDIIVRVDTLIKGEPNLGENHVIFMIQGGVYFSERADAMLRLHVGNQPDFEVGEKVMLFLAVPSSPDSFVANYPHGGLHVISAEFGKKQIVDEIAQFRYIRGENDAILADFPLNLAVNLAKALVKDKDAAIPLEDEIKALALGNTAEKLVLTETLVTRLIADSKHIIDRDEE